MSCLVDTHIFLWWLNDDNRLKTATRTVIADQRNAIFVSVASAWEISIKLTTNPKFHLKTSLKHCFEDTGFTMLPITLNHILALDQLPFYHKDPFDRILIAQALAEQLVLLTADTKFSRYRVETFMN